MATKKKYWEEYSSPYQQLSKDALDKWQNREKFTYDLNADALYNQYKNNYMQQGKLAMKDTVGQVSALTGGYGNSYAQTAGQQAYQGYLQQLNDIVPSLYESAYAKYQQEGNDLYNQWQAMQSLEAQDYARYQDQVAQTQWQMQFDADQAYRNWSKSQAEKKATQTVAFDNGNVDTETIKAMQSHLGLKPTGYWDDVSYNAAGKLTADEAWDLYNQGYSDEKGDFQRGLVGDYDYINNYLVQTPQDYEYNYSYDGKLFTPDLKPTTDDMWDSFVERLKMSTNTAQRYVDSLARNGYDVYEMQAQIEDEKTKK